MSDLVKRLRILDYGIGCEAADRIEELERQIAEARNAALDEAVAVCLDHVEQWSRMSPGRDGELAANICANGIRALKDKPNG